MTTNPLLEPWTTPFGVPPFDRIREEHFAPAFQAAMDANRAEYAAIGADPAPPDFVNTIEALERAGSLLNRVGAVFWNLTSSLSTPALQKVERDIAPRLARHNMEMALDPGIWRRVDALFARRAELTLDPAQARLLERTHR